MSDNEKPKSLLQGQIETLVRYLEDVKKEDILNLSMKIYPVISTQQPYACLLSAIKKQVLLSRSKGAMRENIGNELVAKAYSVDDKIGDQISSMLEKQPQFLSKFQNPSNHSTSSPLIHPPTCNQKQQQKKQVINNNPHSQNITVPANIKEVEIQKLPRNPYKQFVQQKFTPLLGPLRSDNESLHLFAQSLQESNESCVYKIGFKQNVQQKPINNNIYSLMNNGHSQNSSEKKELKEVAQIYTKQIVPNSKDVPQPAYKKKNDPERILNILGDPLSSGRPVTQSPSKSIITPTTFFQQKVFEVLKQKPSSQQQKSKNAKLIADKYAVDSNLIRNLAQKQMCVCQTSCQNIVLSQDSFLCVHCQNIYHTRCMKKTKDSKNCSICNLKLMIPNKVVCQELFVGLMKKGKKKHDMIFQLSEDVYSFLKSIKKDFSHKLQIRCFRLKQQTQNQNLFPDSCFVSLNGKQLKQFKPLHKQSSLKYRKDEIITVTKHLHSGENKISVTQFHASSNIALERIEPEDHLIGMYIVEEEQLNATVQRIVRGYGTTMQQSRSILNKSFYINDEENGHDQMSESEAISCQVVKIPLTCALTTEKLNYPARGIFCQHFQCFDLKNFIMMTSSSSNPRWVCPICKAPCYEFKIDCILTQILGQYTGCNKVETLVLYKNGVYEILDKDEDPIDIKGSKLKQPLNKNISQLKIVDQLKRQRDRQAQRELIKKQQAEKKKKRIIELPPEDQIVSLLSESQERN